MNVIDFNEYKTIPLELGGALPKIAIWYEDSIYDYFIGGKIYE